MNASTVSDIVALGSPVLCLDTCTVLDMMRDPTRDNVHPHERQAGCELLAAAESGPRLVALLADQARLEFQDHLQDVENEATRALGNLKALVNRIDAVAAVYGCGGVADLSHLDDHVRRARAVVDRWIRVARPARQGADVPARAFDRLNLAQTPARKGKDSMKDCVVIETYLEFARALRNAGMSWPIVFASSNVKDYAGVSGSALKSDLAQEFTALGMEFAPNLAAAKHHLGL